MRRLLYFEAEWASVTRDWFNRLAKSPDPQAAAIFRAEAEWLTAEIERIEREKAEAQ